MTIIFLNANDKKEEKIMQIKNALIDCEDILDRAFKLWYKFEKLDFYYVLDQFISTLANEMFTDILNGQRLFKNLNLSVVVR